MISKERLVVMLELQDRLNRVVNPSWMTANFPWHRAIMVEAVEALDHYGWKWWKKQVPDLVQVRLELVDIWHFMLSMALENAQGDYERAAETIASIFYEPTSRTDKSTLMLFDLLAGYAAEGKICVPAYVHLMQELDLSWDQLYDMYIGKNVLNIFRQDHGYQAGSYRKDWCGEEDNIYLAKVMRSCPAATPKDLYESLLLRYEQVVATPITPIEP